MAFAKVPREARRQVDEKEGSREACKVIIGRRACKSSPRAARLAGGILTIISRLVMRRCAGDDGAKVSFRKWTKNH